MVRSARTASLLGALMVASSVAGPEPPEEPAAPPTEYQVKAAYLYSFARYVQWPPEAFAGPADPFVVGVLGEDPFGRILDDTLAGKTVLERPIRVRRYGTPQEAVRAHIVFVGAAEDAERQRILRALRGRAVLSTGDGEGFAESGGIVGFTTKDKRIGFEINLARAEEARLKISSQLLKLATIVTPRS
jgi:YfiR/HmsC-like